MLILGLKGLRENTESHNVQYSLLSLWMPHFLNLTKNYLDQRFTDTS